MVIPAGDIGGVIAPHGVHTSDEVLQGLVQGVTHVQRAVGERRAVMEGEQGLALVLLQQLVIEVDLLPVLQHIRLALGKASPHGKAALGHVQRLFVFHVASPFLCGKIFVCKNKKRLCLVKRQRRDKTSSAVPLSLPRKAATQPHHPWARGDNGPLPSMPTFAFSRMLRGDIRAMPASALHRNGGSLCVRLWRCVSPSSRLYHVYHEISVNITTFSPFVNGIFTKSKEKSGIFQMIPNMVRMPIRPMAV